MMANGVFHTGASKSRGGSPQPSGGGTDWGGLLGIVASGLAALAGGLGRRYYGGTGSSASGGVDYLKQAINHPVQYKPPKDEKFESESWESIIAQGNRVGKAVQYKPNRPWRPGESDEGREVAFPAKKYRQSAPQVGPAQWQPPAAVDHAEPAAFSQAVYDNAPSQVGGIAAAHEALRQKNQPHDDWIVEQPRYHRLMALAQVTADAGVGDLANPGLAALKRLAQSAPQAPLIQSMGLSDINLEALLRELARLSGVPLPEANPLAYRAAGLLLAALLKSARLTGKATKASAKAAKSAAKAPVKTAVRTASRLKPGVYHISKRVIGNRKNIWTKGPPGNADKNLLNHYLKHQKEFPRIKNSEQYSNRAWSIAENPPANALYKVFEEGTRQAIYIRAENTLVIMDEYGTVASMLRPDTGYQYFLTCTEVYYEKNE